MLDSRGTLVKQWKINAAKGQIMQLDIETFSPGIYLIQLQTEKDLQTAKFIKL
ncbi:MAG: T9SS type A sorting domain-containing protein [Bacteroidetes bacterium]|nr:T9SS type A sorting domain-containing protein [Bacteroidota bacterium]